MSSQDSKLLATAVGAAAAGAALAVMAMKMTEAKDSDSKPMYRARSILMNEPTDPTPSLKRQDSGNLIFPHNHEEKMRRRIATRYQIEDENSSPRESVTVRVPATSANVGPGCTYFLYLICCVSGSSVLQKSSC
jgi:hypothetical protein